MKAMAGLIVAMLVLGMTVWAQGQNKDLSSTWIGETVVPNSADKDLVTLVIKKDGDSYSGTVSDSLGMATASPMERVKFENNTLTFDFTILGGGDEVKIKVTLRVSGEKLVGGWESEDGSSGNLEMALKK